MIPRYEQQPISKLFDESAKVAGWDEVEAAVLGAKSTEGRVHAEHAEAIEKALYANPLDLDAWHALEAIRHHDLGAYVELRQDMLPPELAALFHDGLTSYDTEDPATARTIIAACDVAEPRLVECKTVLASQARAYRFTPMIARTHCQWAKLATAGGTMLTWYAELDLAHRMLHVARNECRKSRISGAVGNYGGGLTPEIERLALRRLRLEPYYGAGQIMSRVVFAALAQALANIMSVLDNIAVDFRLGARSGYTLWQEPFGPAQIGSSAMPQKRNPVNMENVSGMARMARHKAAALSENIVSWERRDISQSCVERVEWPDLFHIVVHSLGRITRVLRDMRIYPQTMLQEIKDCRGTYAADEAKNYLAKRLVGHDLSTRDAYGMVQLACFNEFDAAFTAGGGLASLAAAQAHYDTLLNAPGPCGGGGRSIQHRLRHGRLEVHAGLTVDRQTVGRWNSALRAVFSEAGAGAAWQQLFSFEHLLSEEQTLFERVLGD